MPNLLSRVVAVLEQHFPLSLAARSWDNVGLLLEAPFPKPEATKVFLTIDLTSRVADECLADPAIGVAICYHPPIFKPLKKLTLSDAKQEALLRLAARGVSVYAPHTALDNCVNGINDWLASKLGKGKVSPISPEENAPEGQQGAGTGRILVLEKPKPLSELIQNVKDGLGLWHVRVARPHVGVPDKEHLVRSVGICAGSGSSVLNGVEADLYLTGEMGHHDVLDAVAAERGVILCEHTNTERGYLSEVLKPFLEVALNAAEGAPAVAVVCSREDRDPLVVV